jgi:hypothetical protein
MFKRSLCSFLLIFIIVSAYSIDYTWWNEVHHWDGKTSWNQYLKYSSKYMGPNALPMPESVKGLAGSSSFIELNTASHFYTGDNTSDIGYNSAINLVKNYITLQVFGTLVEHYKMDTATRNIRGCRGFSGKGYAMGDVNISTIIQLTRNMVFPDIALRVNLRTASGGMMEDARYTDGPGYYFDLSMGKNIEIKSQFLNKIKLYTDVGFYCWQTEFVEKRQSDAIMYSFGFDLAAINSWQLSNEISGYNGHLGDGDRPLLYRTSLHFSKNRNQFYIQYSYGIRDYVYHSVRLGYIFYFEIKPPKDVH